MYRAGYRRACTPCQLKIPSAEAGSGTHEKSGMNTETHKRSATEHNKNSLHETSIQRFPHQRALIEAN